jgi:hypothetical protein
LALPTNIRLVWKRSAIAREKHSSLFIPSKITKKSYKRFPPGPNVIKLLLSLSYEFSKQAIVLFPGRHLLLGAPHFGKLLALPTNIRLVFKGLPRENTLAYLDH